MQVCIRERLGTITLGQTQGAGLCVVPLLGPSLDVPEYWMLADAGEQVRVTEVSQAGSVPNLRVTNRCERRVFLMDGQELRGAKQNRILNTDVLVPASSQTTIPVSCVERGRWSWRSEAFRPGLTAPFRTRARKSERVYASLKESRGHDADQGAVWQEVKETLLHAGAFSQSDALEAAYEAREPEIRRQRERLVLPDSAVGMAIVRDGRLLGLDLFDRASTMRRFFDALLSSYLVDASCAPREGSPEATVDTTQQAVSDALRALSEAEWESFPTPGEGVDWRISTPGLSGSALVWEDRSVVHLQAFVIEEAARGRARPRATPRESSPRERQLQALREEERRLLGRLRRISLERRLLRDDEDPAAWMPPPRRPSASTGPGAEGSEP